MESFGFLLIGVIMFVAGFVLRFIPPKNINALYGYRTSRSMRSQEAWDFAQRYSGKALLVAALAYTAVYFIIMYSAILESSEEAFFFLPLMIACFASVFWTVERKLKQRFG